MITPSTHPPITSFQGQNRWLSNFWPSVITIYGLQFPTVENAYQAAKCLDVADRQLFLHCTPAQAKRLSRSIQVRSDWPGVKLVEMNKCLRAKFLIPDLRHRLLATHDAQLIEGNHWNDTFWGVCNGVGSNHLGRLLMDIRTDLQNGVT